MYLIFNKNKKGDKNITLNKFTDMCFLLERLRKKVQQVDSLLLQFINIF
jgi:hypothetical protein